ncbi:MAG: hypothetical protein A3B37_00170 [Candidatus Sungbacteria bacterium RIFCSPLOWO2_01_FULL_59_16]|uniref:Uncharacterized protein n=1 Tax=Candidatus Sungbacteria bacterium RIFCSPLOWO2_01_FULL_59_16 TaxID=1802280 RepID=A0A1G2LAC8_9BACT|nr:MAG: hypothetical protein A3B37_00170 [Candidatus Sungbacteria bacterium RIFCSPLOWO2_01_FULL_59_16]
MKSVRRKVIAGIATAGAALTLLPLFAAFEAHVINVTAKIENALTVNATPLDFGTVFPQEHLNLPLAIRLSDSFIAEGRVDDVNYFIRQKPKCGITTNNGEVLVGPTATGHVSLGPVDELIIDCGPEPRPLVQGETWGVLPSLCEYISKEPDKDPQPGNDGSLASFHEPFTFVGRQLVWNDTLGRLAKSEQDTVDNWTIDLTVPCFGGFCAQDWEDFVHGINPQADPDLYTQPIANEHKIFGCDLWVEVFGVSLCDTGEQTVVSDATNTVVDGDDGLAEAIAPVPGAWTASIPGATWIWEQNPVQPPVAGETYTFVKTFNIAGSVVGASIQIASDNTYSVEVNNVVVCSSADATNFTLATQDVCVINNLVTGNNTLEITVANAGGNSDPVFNPAGLLYKLTYEQTCSE